MCNDTDGDTICDVVDICPGGNDLVDNDGNGEPDDCDACPFGDQDGDGVCDNIDNCPTQKNADQSDIDEDDIGDVCEEEICNGIDDNNDGTIDE